MTQAQDDPITTNDSVVVASKSSSSSSSSIVRAPLKYYGPYPCISLRFPHLATSAQRTKNVAGISMDFLVDTAANTNTINGAVAMELQLSVVGESLPGIGTAGSIPSARTYRLGGTQLENAEIIPGESIEPTSHKDNELDVQESDDDDDDARVITPKEPFLFMEGLTASALPVASPSGAGLLSLAFLQCFEGGVEFTWGSSQSSNAMMKDGMPAKENQPSITFYGDGDDDTIAQLVQSMTRVQIDPVPVTLLPSITVRVNGIEMKALIDTGSPITVLNEQAAKQAGIETFQLPMSDKKKKNSLNPFAGIGEKLQEAQALQQAASRGEVLMIAGTNGQPTNLFRSKEVVPIVIPSAESNEKEVQFGEEGTSLYVGDLPGLAALNGLGVDSPPAVVLGMDVLRTRPKMLLRAQTNDVYF